MENKINYQVDKTKHIIKTIALIVAIFLSSILLSEKTYNLLIDYTFAQYVPSESVTIIRYILPVIVTAIYYALFYVYTRIITSSLNTQLTLFSHHFEYEQIRDLLMLPFIVLTLYVGALDLFFVFYPYLAKLLLTLLKCLGLIGIIYWIYKNIASVCDKNVHVLVLNRLKWPLILLVVLV